MKRYRILATLAILGAAAALAACANPAQNPDGEAETGTYYGIESTESVYAVAAVTTAELLSFSQGTANAASVALTDAQDSVIAEAEDFNRYFNMLDSFLDKAETKTVVAANDAADEAVKDYAYKLTVTGKDAAGQDASHTVYFSETAQTPVHRTETDGDETVTVDETVYTLQGAVAMPGAEGTVYYRMTGTRTERTVTETEHGETETEHESVLAMKAFADGTDAGNYVELLHTQSSEEETGETESESLYTYRIFAGGVLVEETAIGFENETEQGETETEYSVRFLKGGSRGFYEIERETVVGGVTSVEVNYVIDGTRGTFTVVKDGENYRYRFGDGTEDKNFRDFHG